MVEVLRERGFFVELASPQGEENWIQLGFRLPSGAVVDLDFAAAGGPASDLFGEEIEEFIGFANDAEGSRDDKQLVVERLREVRAIFAISIPSSDWEGGLDVGAELLRSLSGDSAAALTQADGEGFFDVGGELLIEID